MSKIKPQPDRPFPIVLREVKFIRSCTTPAAFPQTGLPEVAFAGRSNVGKSSLINALVRRKGLVKVSNTPGRTQLVNFFQVNDDLSVVDLPGYGFAKVPMEVKETWGDMIEGYLSTRETIEAVVVLMDVRRGAQEDDIQLIEALPFFGIQPILVFTKADKLKGNALRQRRRELAEHLQTSPSDILLTSTHLRSGLHELWERILMLARPKPPGAGGSGGEEE